MFYSTAQLKYFHIKLIIWPIKKKYLTYHEESYT